MIACGAINNIVENAMRKTVTTIVAAAGVAAAAVISPQPAEARCIGCWVGAGIAAGIIGGALASYGYGYGYGYGPSYGTYAYAPAYSYAPAYNGRYAPGAYYGGNYRTPLLSLLDEGYLTRSRNGSLRLELQGRCFPFP
jgi:hypothetical protein